ALVKVLMEEAAPELREVIVDVLGQYGTHASDAAPELIKALKDPQLAMRRKAVIALGKLGPEAKNAIPDLRALLKTESDKPLLCYTIRRLGGFGKDAGEAVPDLIAKCGADSALEVRLAAIEELGRIGPDAKDAVTALTLAQKDGRADVREAAAEALK